MARSVFLLSPAYCGGRRARMLLRPGATLGLAGQLREGTLSLGDAFAFMSGLYFRGKLAYATAFDPVALRTYVITPTRGLLSPRVVASAELLEEFAAVDVNSDDPRYRAPLERDIAALARSLEPADQVVLLGSIASGKYVDVLSTILGSRLHFPVSFIGRGDMSRGGLLLRCAKAVEELEYAVLDPSAPRRGKRPPKLDPIR
jgi:hypothetical protein